MDEAHPHFHQAPDEAHNVKALGVGFLALVIFALATLWGFLLLRHHSRGHSIPQITFLPAPARTTPEVGMLFQWQFQDRYAVPPLHSVEEQQLETYGWVDPARNRIHIPVSRAIELYLAGQRAGGAGQHE